MAHYFPSGYNSCALFCHSFSNAGVINNNYYWTNEKLRGPRGDSFVSQCVHIHYLCTLCGGCVQPIRYSLTVRLISEAKLDM